MRATLCACALLLTAAPAAAQERCTDTAAIRTCTSAVGPVRTRTVADLPGGDIAEAEVFAPAKYADSPGFARAAGGLILHLVPFSTVNERTGLFARLMKVRAHPSAPWVRFGRHDWRAVERDGVVRVEAMRMERP
jgi:hypothetical protein